MLGSIGFTEMLVLGGIVAVLFGAKRIPEVFHGLGRGISDLKRGLRGDDFGPMPDGGAVRRAEAAEADTKPTEQ